MLKDPHASDVSHLLCFSVSIPVLSKAYPVVCHSHDESPTLRRFHCRPTCTAHSFEEAVQKGYVKDFGRKVPLNAEGHLPESSDLEVSSLDVGVFDSAAEAVLKTLGRSSVTAIFVRGSVLTGNILDDGRSDVDFIIFAEVNSSLQVRRKLSSHLFSILRVHFNIGRVDVRLQHAGGTIDPTLATTLLHYSAPIYGSYDAVNMFFHQHQPVPNLGIDIRQDQQRFRHVFQGRQGEEDFQAKLSVLQWFLKRCLRALAELACKRSSFHCRDLVPCYQAVSSCFSEYSQCALKALQLACASEENRLLGMGRSELLSAGWQVASDMADIVEQKTLEYYFGAAVVNGHVAREIVGHQAGAKRDMASVFNTFRGMAEDLRLSLSPHGKLAPLSSTRRFRKTTLPPISISSSKPIREERFYREHGTQLKGVGLPDNILHTFDEPVVFRSVPSIALEMSSIASLHRIIQLVPTVECRLSASNVVMFCRSTHPWIEEGSFSPPSQLLCLPTRDAVERLYADTILKTDRADGFAEHIYIQTKVPKMERLFKKIPEGAQEAQPERLWISYHGTVSPLHYDASHSVLCQRSGLKRMIFFPPDVLDQIGVYPLGHPLHRRARVRLDNPNSIVFRKFWENSNRMCSEVLLEPGDVVVFPPFWSHYTESRTDSDQELSISHTYRFY